jgi:hypothetical protein
MKAKRWSLRVDRRLFIIGLLVLVTMMVMATQFAVTRLGYEFNIVHPGNSNLRFIGSDNSSDGIRILRVAGSNTSNVAFKLVFGNLTTNQTLTYTAAIGIVNENLYPVNITYIAVNSSNWTCMKIWLHGNRDENANNSTIDPSSVFMFNNGTIVNGTNTTAWILAEGNKNPNDMCSNVSDRINTSSNTTWDETAHVRYSLNNTNATSALSDYVWVQIQIEVDQYYDTIGPHTGVIYFHFAADSFS